MFILPNVRDWYIGQIVSGYLAAHAGDETALPKKAEVADYDLALADELLARREKDRPADPAAAADIAPPAPAGDDRPAA